MVWDGSNSVLNSDPADVTAPSTQAYGLWPYKIHDPGNPDDGKYIFKVMKPSRVTNFHRFRLGNYYSYIGDNIINANPKLVRNPNQ